VIKIQSIARQFTADPVMEELFAADISARTGMEGDMHPLSAAGEISVLSKESWVKSYHETEVELPWLASGSHLFIRGFEFLPTDIGRSLRIGEMLLEILRENLPAPALASQAPVLRESLCLGWRGGVVCNILRSGSIQTGDTVHIIG